MKLANISLDDGSLMIALIIAGGGLWALIRHWSNIDIISAIVAGAAIAIIVSLILWQSVRVGRDLQRLKDVRRWLGEKSDEASDK